MPPLIPIETLSYYLTKTGFLKFKKWFETIDLLSPIHDELDKLTYFIENTTWLEDKLRKDAIAKIRSIIMKHIENTINKDPNTYFEDWVNSIQKYCYQGGYGYRIQYSGVFPHHWCVYADYYNDVKNIPDLVILCGIVCDKYINLSDKPETMHWSQ